MVLFASSFGADLNREKCNSRASVCADAQHAWIMLNEEHSGIAAANDVKFLLSSETQLFDILILRTHKPLHKFGSS